jgi:hypothetical protein
MKLSLFVFALLLAVSAYVVFEAVRPELLLAGTVTVDVVEGKGTKYVVPGGATLPWPTS